VKGDLLRQKWGQDQLRSEQVFQTLWTSWVLPDPVIRGQGLLRIAKSFAWADSSMLSRRYLLAPMISIPMISFSSSNSAVMLGDSSTLPASSPSFTLMWMILTFQ